MTCKANRQQFSRYLDGGLDAAARAAVEAHVAGCTGCREELARWQILSGALRGAAPAAVPEGLAERAFRAAMAGSVGPAARPVSFLDRFLPVASRTAMVGAAATALIWAGLLIGGGGGSGDSSTVAATDPMEMALAVWTEAPGDAE
jgi:anti-sigma factor RsiW